MTKIRGFTLVEVVVVLLILGVIFAVAAPRVIDTGSEATDIGVRTSLETVRSAIDIYVAENGELPAADGEEATFKNDLAPYLRRFPTCPVGPNPNDLVTISASNGILHGVAIPSRSWKFSNKTGRFIVNFNGPTTCDPSINYDDL